AIADNLRYAWSGIYETPRYLEVSRLTGLGSPADVTASGLVSLVGAVLVALMVAGGAMVGSLFSADAWNNVTFTAGEVRNPRRNLPLSLLFGTGLVITLYLLANVAYLSVLRVNGAPELHAQVQSLSRYADKVHLTKDGAKEQIDAVLDRASVQD